MIHFLRSLTVRVRLTIWYISALATVLLIFSGVIFLLLRGYLYSEVDRLLRQDIEATEELLLDYPADPKTIELAGDRQTWLLEVFTADKQRIYATPTAEGSPLGIEPGCESSKILSRNFQLADGLHLRAACRKVSVGGTTYYIRAARSGERVQEELEEVLLMFLIGIPLALGMSAVGGYFLSRKVLQPISRMTEQAEQISAERLSERLIVQNPDDELGKLASTFNRTFERLQRSFEQVRRFSADASHELRTPLTAIRSMGEVVLREGATIEDYRETVSSVLEETDRLRHLVDSLLTLSRADAGQIQLRLERVDIRDLLEEVADHLGVLAEEKRQTIIKDLEPGLFAVVDRLVIRQALINLIDNAIKYSPVGSSIGISLRRRSDMIEVAVSDEGPGVGEEHQLKIFDRFYRIDHSRSRTQGGTGLGLAISKWAVEVNSGKLTLRSALGSGSTFQIALPLAGG